MCRTVADAAALLGACAGVDSADARTQESEGNSFKDYTQFLDAGALKGKRLGMLGGVFGYHEKVDEVFEAVENVLKEQGAEVVRGISIDDGSIGRAGYDLLLYEFKDGLQKYFASRPDLKIKTLADVIQFNKDNADQEMPFFQQERMDQAEEKGDLSSQEYKDALDKVLSVSRNAIDAALKENELDAIIGVTGGPAWPIDVINGDHFGTGSSSPAAQSGYPNITVPAGFVHGLPVGMSIFAGKFEEPKLIGIAYAFEQATKFRRAPKLKPTLGLI